MENITITRNGVKHGEWRTPTAEMLYPRAQAAVQQKNQSPAPVSHYTFNITGDNVRIQIGAVDTVQEANGTNRIEEICTQLKRLVDEAVEDRKKAAEARKEAEEDRKVAAEERKKIGEGRKTATEALQKFLEDKKKAEEEWKKEAENRRRAEEELEEGNQTEEEFLGDQDENLEGGDRGYRYTRSGYCWKAPEPEEDPHTEDEFVEEWHIREREDDDLEEVRSEYCAEEMREDRSVYAWEKDEKKKEENNKGSREEVVDSFDGSESGSDEEEDNSDAEEGSDGWNKHEPVAPNRAMSGFFFWLRENREKIKKPEMGIPDLAKASGIAWGKLRDKSKWEQMAVDDKKRYEDEMTAYKMALAKKSRDLFGK